MSCGALSKVLEQIGHGNRPATKAEDEDELAVGAEDGDEPKELADADEGLGKDERDDCVNRELEWGWVTEVGLALGGIVNNHS